MTRYNFGIANLSNFCSNFLSKILLSFLKVIKVVSDTWTYIKDYITSSNKTQDSIDLLLLKKSNILSVKSSYVGYIKEDKKIIERDK